MIVNLFHDRKELHFGNQAQSLASISHVLLSFSATASGALIAYAIARAFGSRRLRRSGLREHRGATY
jgi:membrane protein DedA with SNARE-associated domain